VYEPLWNPTHDKNTHVLVSPRNKNPTNTDIPSRTSICGCASMGRRWRLANVLEYWKNVLCIHVRRVALLLWCTTTRYSPPYTRILSGTVYSPKSATIMSTKPLSGVHRIGVDMESCKGNHQHVRRHPGIASIVATECTTLFKLIEATTGLIEALDVETHS
jgi:hypothetical protein